MLGQRTILWQVLEFLFFVAFIAADFNKTTEIYFIFNTVHTSNGKLRFLHMHAHKIATPFISESFQHLNRTLIHPLRDSQR